MLLANQTANLTVILLFETFSCLLQAFSGTSCRVCFCGQTLPRSVQAHLRSHRSLRVCAEEGSQARTEQGTSQSSSNGSGPPQPDQPSDSKKQGPRLSFAPNTRSVKHEQYNIPTPSMTSCTLDKSQMLLMQGMGYTEDDSAGQTNIFAVEVSCDLGSLKLVQCTGSMAFILPWFPKP